jgi:hypothetical protein
VLAGAEGRDHDLVVRARVGDDVERVDLAVGDRVDDVRVDLRSLTEQARDLVGAEARVLLLQIADRHDLEIRDPGVLELLVAEYVALPHAATTDQADWNARH